MLFHCILFTAAVSVLCDYDIISGANEVNALSQCSPNLKEKFDKMTLREKSRELQRLQTANTSALTMSNIMKEYVDWDKFLYSLPVIVTELGKLMLYSNKQDFSLVRKGVKLKYIRKPESFRATLVQLAFSEWDTVHSAHQNLDAIRMSSSVIPRIYQIIFRMLERKMDERRSQRLRAQLSRAGNLARKNMKYCQNSISKIVSTIELINEIQMATLSSQSMEKTLLSRAENDKKVLAAQISSTAKELADVDRELSSQLQKVNQYQREYEKAQRKAKPKTGLILLSVICDAATSVFTILSKGGARREPGRAAHSEVQNYTIAKEMESVEEALNIADFMEKMLLSKNRTNRIFDEIEEFLSKAKFFKIDSLKELFTKLLRDFGNSLENFAETNESNYEKLIRRVEEAKEVAKQEEARLSATAAGNGNRKNLDNMLDQIGSSVGGGVFGALINSRMTQLQSMTRMLIDAHKRHENLFYKKLEVMKQQDQYLSKMVEVQSIAVDITAILDIMRKGLQSLAEQITQWKNFLEFYKMIERLTLLSTKQTELFVSISLAGTSSGALLGLYGNDEVYMDLLYENSFMTVDIATALREIASTYVRVSNQHVFPYLNGLTKLLTVVDDNQIKVEFKNLATNAKKAYSEFKAEFEADYQRQKEMVQKRVHQITCYTNFLLEDPSIKNVLKESHITAVPDF